MTTQIKLRRDTAANWTSINPVLSLGEPGLETDTRKVKYGDGTTVWTALLYSAGDANFSGNYNDLVNTPIIPSIDGLATEVYVNNAIESISSVDLTSYALKSEVPSISGLATESYVTDAISGIQSGHSFNFAGQWDFSGPGYNVGDVVRADDNNLYIAVQPVPQSTAGLSDTAYWQPFLQSGTNGTNGTNGQGVPTGGTTGQVLAKVDGTDYNTEWVNQTSSGASLGNLNVYDNILYSNTNTDVYISSSLGEGPGYSYLKLPNDNNATANPVVLTNHKADGAGVNIVTSNPFNGATEHTWNFGADGALTLPAGGDIVDSAGTSVLGGSIGATALSALSDVGLEDPGEGQVLTWNNNANHWENRGVPTSSQIINGDGFNAYSVNVGTDGVITMNTARGGIEIGAMPEVGGPTHLHIMRPAGQNGSTDLYFGDDYNYVKMPSSSYAQQGVEIGSSLNEGSVSVWKFGTDGDLVLPEGKTIRDTDGVNLLGTDARPQYGYFTEMSNTADSNRVNGEAVAMDSEGNSYVSYSYYSQNDDRDYGGVAKFSGTGEKLWSVNISSQNSDARYPQIRSLEYTTIGGGPILIAFGNYYDIITQKDVAIMYAINPETGEVGLPLFDAEITSDFGMELIDGVVGVDSNNTPFAVVVGSTYDQKLTKILTPLAGSTVDKLYFSWSEINASGLNNGDQLTTNIGGYSGFYVNGAQALATPTGTGDGISLTVSSTEAGEYVITGVNGWSGALSSWDVPVTLRVLGSNLGGVNNVNYTVTSDAITGNGSLFFEASTYPDLATVQDGWRASGPGITGSVVLSNVQFVGGYYRFDVPNGITLSPNETYTIIDSNGNDLTFDFDRTVFNYDSNNITAAVSNKQGTPISTVYCTAFNGRDWSVDIGTPVTFEYNLNNQAFIGRFGGNAWTKNIGTTDYDRINSVVVDSGGNAYAAGYSWNGSRGALVVKYDIDGVQQWAFYIDPADNTGNELTSIDLLADGSLITVDEEGTVTKLSSDTGDIFWQVSADSGPNWDAKFRGTATPDGDYIISNYEYNDYTLYVMRVSGADGSSVWTKRITRTYGGSNGEVTVEGDFNAQFIDCNDTYLTIGANTQPNSGNQTGLVISFPINGQNVAGTYGQYVISSEALDWTTQSTTSIAATLTETSTNVNINSISPSKTDSTLTINKTNIGGEQVAASEVITWTNPNSNNVWRIEKYDGGAFVNYNGTNSVVWWDADNSTSGNANFRGAIIEYHAYYRNAGTIIGTIHIASDGGNYGSVTHTEHMSGGSNTSDCVLWEQDNNNFNNSQLLFKTTNGNSSDLSIQWTSKIFYGQDFYD